jgi:RHS repeat-associated protein
VKRNGAGAVIHDTSYTYDLAQNRTSMTNNLTQSTTTYTYNNMNQMLTAGEMSFTYDANGNTVSKVVSGQTTTYSWDYENKLTRIDYPNGSSNVFSTNADGQRMTANDSGGHRRFIYDGSVLVAEEDLGSGNLIAVYDHGNGGLARQVRGTAASYYQFDGLGSTRQLTDANQAVTDRVSYDAWGNILSSSGTTANAFKYVGELGYYADADNGLMLLGARYYSSGVGRFWSVDPIREGHNWYGYVHNNPVNSLDPTGKAGQVVTSGASS